METVERNRKTQSFRKLGLPETAFLRVELQTTVRQDRELSTRVMDILSFSVVSISRFCNVTFHCLDRSASILYDCPTWQQNCYMLKLPTHNEHLLLRT
eukprot:scaffold6679_cov102-Cylindrotheca_fusiformis.AAC.2